MVDIIRARGKIHLNTVKERSYWWYILHFWVQFVIWWCTLSIRWDYSPNKMMMLGRKAAENSKTNSLTERSFSPLSVCLQDFFLGFFGEYCISASDELQSASSGERHGICAEPERINSGQNCPQDKKDWRSFNRPECQTMTKKSSKSDIDLQCLIQA